jgi:translation initiation factor 1 (eIF-1/SUI1)
MKIAADPWALFTQNVAITLKEFMARQLQNVTTLRNTQITDMVAFTDKLAAKLATKCACCSARGFPTCILNEPTEGEG